MGLITNSDLQAIADKLARFATESVGDPEFNADFNAGMELASNNVLSGSNSIAQYILDLDSEDVEADLLPTARDLDEDHPTPADGFLLQIKGVNSMIAALNAHYKRYGGVASMDAYLTSQNAAAPTLRFHGHFRKYLKTISAINSFIPNDLDIGSFTVSGATAGTYAHLSAISKTEFGGAKLVLKNVGAISDTTGVSVTAKKWDGTTVTLTASISNLSDGHETDLSDTGKLFIDATAIAVTGATATDVFKVVAKTDRDISAA